MKSAIVAAAALLVATGAHAFNEGSYPEVAFESTKSRADVLKELAAPDTFSRWLFHGDVMIDNPHYRAPVASAPMPADETQPAQAVIDLNIYVG
jgi:hypothetical protein